MKRLSAGLMHGLRLAVLLLASTVVVLAALCHVGPSQRTLMLATYAPLALLCLPALGLLLASVLWLKPVWRIVSVCSLLLLLTVVMDGVWGHADAGAGRVRLMTYNAKTFKAVARPGGLAQLALEIADHDPDVIVMQDASDLVSRQAHDVALRQAMFGSRQVYATGQYIVASRFPLRSCQVDALPYRQQMHTDVHCWVEAHGRVFELINVHLMTPREGLNAVRHEGWRGLDAWRRNVDDRSAQAQALAQAARQRGHALVIAGDLNAPERSEVVRLLLNTGLRDAFSSAGHGYGYTHGHSLKPGLSFLRIDHILLSDELGVSHAEVGGAEASEHRPVVADLWMQRH